jgi:hypothetical protein
MRILWALVALLVAVAAVKVPTRCLDGTTRIDVMNCPGGMAARWADDAVTKGPEAKQFACSDGTFRYDQANCPGGATVGAGHQIDPNAAPAEEAKAETEGAAPATSGGEARFVNTPVDGTTSKALRH